MAGQAGPPATHPPWRRPCFARATPAGRERFGDWVEVALGVGWATELSPARAAKARPGSRIAVFPGRNA
nr:hypothetical protein Aca09nite_86140 [Actinoplanes campanulatus]